MENAPQKLDVHNCEEILDFGIGAIDDLAAKKSDDGKISLIEAGQVLVENTPAAWLAAKDADQVKAEIEDMDHEEAKKLAAKGMLLAQALMKLIAAGKPA